MRWFEKQRKQSEYGRFNRVLQQVHQQFFGETWEMMGDGMAVMEVMEVMDG